VAFQWSEECDEAFRRLKRSLTTAPILSLPRDDAGSVLDTDASNCGLGVVLSQLQDGEEKVILCASRLLSKAERNYDTTKKELLAVVHGLKQCRQYLLGRSFVVRRDHATLSWLRRTPEPMPQLARWLTFIEEFSSDSTESAGSIKTLIRCRECRFATRERCWKWSLGSFESQQQLNKGTSLNLLAAS